MRRVRFIDPRHEGAPQGFVVHPHELAACIHALVCHEATRETGTIIDLPRCVARKNVLGAPDRKINY
jgi:hypothetical protein